MRQSWTRAFLRLRNIKQLGLAHFVYPSADYSRYAHAIGVCNITGRLLEEFDQTIRILDASGDSQPITEVSNSLFRVLANHAVYAIRVYLVQLRDQRESLPKRFGALIRKELPEVVWE